MLFNEGISLTKLWFSVSASEQRTRFTIRQVDPVRQWKLSPTDLASLEKWHDYTAAKEDMFSGRTPRSRRGPSSRATTRSVPGSTPCGMS
jgi:polyphosphate kinase 2 (PPK2 family)